MSFASKAQVSVAVICPSDLIYNEDLAFTKMDLIFLVFIGQPHSVLLASSVHLWKKLCIQTLEN